MSQYYLNVRDKFYPTVEHFYQFLRFIEHPDTAENIRLTLSPISAKLLAYENLNLTRNDWDKEKVKIMRFCLKEKFYPYEEFALMIKQTSEPIVEISYKSQFWGAKPFNGTFVGQNVLGRLLMEIRGNL